MSEPPSSRTYVRDLDQLDKVPRAARNDDDERAPVVPNAVSDLDQLDKVPRAARNDGEERLPSSRTQ